MPENLSSGLVRVLKTWNRGLKLKAVERERVCVEKKQDSSIM